MSTFLKKHKLALVVILIVLVVGIAVAAVFTAQQSTSEAESLARHARSNAWTQSSTSLRKGLHMHLEVDQRGNDIPVCDVDAIDPALLENLATAYNASPWSEGFEPYTGEELKRELGDELVSILGKKNSRDSRLFSFLTWCDVPADLVYTGSSTAYPNEGGAISNIIYLSTPESFPYCELRSLAEGDIQ